MIGQWHLNNSNGGLPKNLHIVLGFLWQSDSKSSSLTKKYFEWLLDTQSHVINKCLHNSNTCVLVWISMYLFITWPIHLNYLAAFFYITGWNYIVHLCSNKLSSRVMTLISVIRGSNLTLGLFWEILWQLSMAVLCVVSDNKETWVEGLWLYLLLIKHRIQRCTLTESIQYPSYTSTHTTKRITLISQYCIIFIFCVEIFLYI